MSSPALFPEQNADLLYRQHRQWVQRWLLRKVHCHADADDLTQDVFIRTLGSKELGRIVEPRAFLTTLAQRVLYNFWRRQELEQAYLEALRALPEATLPSAEELALVREIIVQLDQLLNGLPPKVRQAFLLNRLEDMTHGSIAQAMNLSIATIERYIKQALTHCYLARLSAVTD